MSDPGFEIHLNKEILLEAHQQGKDLKGLLAETLVELLGVEEKDWKSGDREAFHLHADAHVILKLAQVDTIGIDPWACDCKALESEEATEGATGNG